MGYVLILEAVRELELLEKDRNHVAVGRGSGVEEDGSFTGHDVFVDRLKWEFEVIGLESGDRERRRQGSYIPRNSCTRAQQSIGRHLLCALVTSSIYIVLCKLDQLPCYLYPELLSYWPGQCPQPEWTSFLLLTHMDPFISGNERIQAGS